MWFIITGVVILIIVVAVALSFHSGTIYITVTHACCVSTIDTTVTVDGSTIASVSIAPGYQWQDSYGVTWFGDGCETHTVVAYGSGGLAGPTTDTQTIDVCSGGSAQVSLSV